jgi:hypothetical protein
MTDQRVPDGVAGVAAASDRAMTSRGSRKWWALSAVCLGCLAVGVDGTVLSEALPTLSKALGSAASWGIWRGICLRPGPTRVGPRGELRPLSPPNRTCGLRISPDRRQPRRSLDLGGQGTGFAAALGRDRCLWCYGRPPNGAVGRAVTGAIGERRGPASNGNERSAWADSRGPRCR